MLSFSIDKLQFRELVFDLKVCPVTFKVLNVLFVLITFFKSYNLLDMIVPPFVGDSDTDSGSTGTGVGSGWVRVQVRDQGFLSWNGDEA